MVWLVMFAVLALLGGLGAVVNLNRLRFDRRVAQELRALIAATASRQAPLAAGALPPVVERYLRLAVGDRAPGSDGEPSFCI